MTRIKEMITDTTIDEMYEKLSRMLADTVPDFELRLKEIGRASCRERV